jgi:glycogen synthase
MTGEKIGKSIAYTCNVSETYARIIELTNKLEAMQKVFTYRQIAHYRNKYNSEKAQLLYMETLEDCFNDIFYKKRLESKEYDLSTISGIAELKEYSNCDCLDCEKK